MGTLDFSPMSVTVQAIGTLLLGIMLAQLGHILTRNYAVRWAWAWVALFASLCCVWADIHTNQHAFWAAYLLLEWLYLLLLWSGCREMATGASFDLKYALYAFPAALVIAAALAHFEPTFDDMFTVQAAIIAIAMALSFRVLSKVAPERRGRGYAAMRAALLLEAALFASYVPLYIYNDHISNLTILGYSSLADLLVAIVLGFGMVLVTAEETNRELKAVLRRLDDARSHLEVKLQTDPLTEALNRHAFYSMQRGDEIATDGMLAGVVVMIDVDNLKQINDALGHAAGDAVIRTTANVIRHMIRADDLLFRWGGDEFVAIVPNSTMDAVAERLAPLRDGVVAHVSAEHPALNFRVSWGAAEFGINQTLDEAIHIADEAMYDARRAEQA